MKIIPLVTVQDTDVKGQRVYHPANQVVDLPKEKATDLLARGFAITPEAAALPTASDDGPKIIQEA